MRTRCNRARGQTQTRASWTIAPEDYKQTRPSWRHLDDTSLKSTEKIKKLYMSALLNEFEKFLVFGSV
jgi:hypothetical protein